MLRYHNKPPRRHMDKPVTKAIAQQRRAESTDKLFQAFSSVYFSLMGLIILGLVIFQGYASAAPRVGDQLHFNHAVLGPGFAPTSVAAQSIAGPLAKPGAACTLDERAMIDEGGTFTIAALETNGAVLNWAGGPTDAKQPCAPGAVFVSMDGLGKLRWAVERHRPPLR
jgi:hypothetical protein